MAEPGDAMRAGREEVPAPAAQDPFVVIVDDEPGDGAETGAAGNAAPAEDRAGTAALNDVRVRQLSALRRGAYRARSYCLVGLGVCVVAAAQMVMMTARHVRAAGWQWRPAGYLCGVVAAAMAAAFFLRRAAELTRELRKRPEALAEPPTPPDFSTLSDGSHHWKNLEQMKDGA